MWKLSVIGERSELEKNKAALKLSEFGVEFVSREECEGANFEDSVALIVFPWDGFKDLFSVPKFKHYIEQKSVVVVGPTIHFFEVEEWVIDGSVCFLSNPVNSIQIESVVNEILRIRGFTQSANKNALRDSA